MYFNKNLFCIIVSVFLSSCVLNIYPQQRSEDINYQVGLIQSSDKSQQLEGLKNLCRLGTEAKDAVPYLINLLNKNDDDDEIKKLVVETLGEIKDDNEKTILALINCFYDDNPYLNGKAVDALAKIGDKVMSYIKNYLKDDNENVRWCTSITLGKIIPASKDAVPELIGSLKDSNSNVRWSSAIALGNLGEKAKEGLPELLKCLNDVDREVRWASYIAIKKINPYFVFNSPSVSSVNAIIDSLVPLLMDELHVPGVSIAVITNNEISGLRSFGVMNVNSEAKVTDETMFEACSMSKPVFALIVLKLVAQNKLDLDTPLSTYLEEPFYSDDAFGKMITARMILSHTSGLPNWRKGEEERDGPLPIYFTPGERFSYSGEGFFYLQRVVEKITGKPLEEFAKENLFQPLGLEHTSYMWTEKFDSLISCGHDASGNFLAKSKYLHPNSAYTLYTTAKEYAKLIVEILRAFDSGEHLLSKKTIEQMLSPKVSVYIRDPIDRPGRALGLFVYWGLGWAIDSTASGKIYYHSGANRTGFRCYSQFRIDDGTGIVIMTNGLNGSELWRKLIGVIGDL